MKPRERAHPRRIDWPSLRDSLDLAEVATRVLGPAPGRRGERSDRLLWWNCPFHDDANPSFCVTRGAKGWRCYGCREHGNALSLVMRIKGLTFPEAIRFLAGEAFPSRGPGPRPKPRTIPPRPPEPAKMSPAEAESLVAEAERRLWLPEGSEALEYLRGPRRRLRDETIRAARLGVITEGRRGSPAGIVIPWFAGSAITLIKVRRPDGAKPKYLEAFRDRARHVGIYPDSGIIRHGRPLVIPEGEFDALLLGQELGDSAPVVTLGSASARPTPRILARMLPAAPWYIATDADPAGDRSAADWPAPSRRVRPPAPFKDWTEARGAGVDLRRWWGEVLAGNLAPHPSTLDDHTGCRSGPSMSDPSPGIVIVRPDPSRMLAALRNADPNDPYAVAEREAIRSENDPMPLDILG